MVGALIAEAQPEAVKQLDRVQPDAAHLVILMVPEVGEIALLRGDYLDSLAGAEAESSRGVGGFLKFHNEIVPFLLVFLIF